MPTTASPAEPERLLADLNDAQLEAVRAVDGPVAIIAGAGTGKTRVISRRAAYAIATGYVPPDQVLVVTFTDKAAGEMADRLRGLGLPGVTARTFHAHALSQLRFFWPLHHDGAPLPDLLDSKLPLLIRITRRLPGHYRFTPAKDLADEIEWAKSRRIEPAAYERAAAAAHREPPIPVDLFVRSFADYERDKRRAGRIDFDDLLTGTIDLLEGDPDAAATVRARKRWFSVDEYQDTNPLQERLLELWAGTSTRPVRRRRRRPDDLHVRRRVAGLPRVIRRPPRRRPRHRPDRELPLDARGPRAREPAPVERRPAEDAHGDATERTGPGDRPASE